MEVFILVLIGLIAGAIGALAGLGGGIIIVPALLFFGTSLNWIDSITPQAAVGTSSVIMIFTGLSSTIAYLKHKTTDYKTALLFFVGSGPGTIVGAFTNKILDFHSFNLYFGCFMIFIAVLLLVKDKIKPLGLKPGKGVHRKFVDNNGKEYAYGFKPLQAIALAFVVGFSSGLFGIGGGSLLVPAMILLFMFPPHVAVATSMFVIFLSSFTNSITHISLGNVNWMFALALIPGAWIGAKVGAFINLRLKGGALVNVLRITLIIIGIRLIYQGITG